MYTHTTATLGTSLSYTRDISTSFTGADAQTVVEDSRITLIGRAQVSPSDKRGAEITRLLGPGFINSNNPDIDIFNVIAGDVQQLAADLKALQAATTLSAMQSSVKTALGPDPE